MPELDPDLLDAAIVAGNPALEGFDPATAVEAAGGDLEQLLGTFGRVPGLNRTQQVSQLAKELAELTTGQPVNKKSRAYQNAHRQVRRWSPSPQQRAKGRKPQRPKKPSRERLGAAQIMRHERLAAFRAHGGEMRALLRWSENYDWVPGKEETVHIRVAVMRRVVALWAAGDKATAADELWNEFTRQFSRGPFQRAHGEVVQIRLSPSSLGGGADKRYKPWKPPRKRGTAQ